MKVLLQRVNHSSVIVDSKICGQAGRGLLLLVGFGADDNAQKLPTMAEKVLNLRIFPDEQGRFNLSCLDIGGEVLLVPQFTLYAETNKSGRRPGFSAALEPVKAKELFDIFVLEIEKLSGKAAAKGIFGAHMKVSLENDGPVTIMLEV